MSDLTTLLNAVTSTGASSVVALGSNRRVNALVSGITNATVKLQGSMDNSNWVDLGSDFTADGQQLEITCPGYIRGNVTAYVSGTITMKIEILPRV